MICTFLFVHNRPCATYRILPSNSRMPNQAQDFEGAVLDSSSTIYRSNFFWKCSLRCSLLSEQNFSFRIKGVFSIESPFSVHLIVLCVTSVYFQSAKFRTFQPVNMYQEAPTACRCLLTEKICFRTSSAERPCGLCRCKPCRWEKRISSIRAALQGYPCQHGKSPWDGRCQAHEPAVPR